MFLFILVVVRCNGPVTRKGFVICRNRLGTRSDGLFHKGLDHVAYPGHRIERTAENDDGNDRQLPGIVEKYADQREGREQTRQEHPQVGQQARASQIGVIVEAKNNITGILTVEKGSFKRQELVI